MLIFILFVLLIVIGGYFAFRYVERTTPASKILTPQTDMEFSEELTGQKKADVFAPWEDNPQLQLSDDRPSIHLMLKDPEWLYCYWHWGSNSQEIFQDFYNEPWEKSVPVLRYHELKTNVTFDLKISHQQNSQYIRTNCPNTSVIIYLGRILNGKFIQLACSNMVTIPTGHMAFEIDPHWQPIEGLMPANLFSNVSSPELLDPNKRG